MGTEPKNQYVWVARSCPSSSGQHCPDQGWSEGLGTGMGVKGQGVRCQPSVRQIALPVTCQPSSVGHPAATKAQAVPALGQLVHPRWEVGTGIGLGVPWEGIRTWDRQQAHPDPSGDIPPPLQRCPILCTNCRLRCCLSLVWHKGFNQHQGI